MDLRQGLPDSQPLDHTHSLHHASTTSYPSYITLSSSPSPCPSFFSLSPLALPLLLLPIPLLNTRVQGYLSTAPAWIAEEIDVGLLGKMQMAKT